MAALHPRQRTGVLEEAKRNIKKWPSLTNTQRVEVNCALVDLRRTKDCGENDEYLSQLSPGERAKFYPDVEDVFPLEGSYHPVFRTDYEGELDLRYEWMPEDYEFPLSQNDHKANIYQAATCQSDQSDTSEHTEADFDDDTCSSLSVHTSPGTDCECFFQLSDVKNDTSNGLSLTAHDDTYHALDEPPAHNETKSDADPVAPLHPYFLQKDHVMFFPTSPKLSIQVIDRKVEKDERDLFFPSSPKLNHGSKDINLQADDHLMFFPLSPKLKADPQSHGMPIDGGDNKGVSGGELDEEFSHEDDSTPWLRRGEDWPLRGSWV